MDYSILIPVYNEDVTALVSALQKQVIQVGKRGEILILDDASTNSAIKKANQALNDLGHVHYEELSKNKGRSAVRNQLAAMASGEHLIFLDADVSLLDESFIERYVPFFGKDMVVNGGHIYSDSAPKETLRLNWRYARVYESKSAFQRNTNPYAGFISMNFMMPAKWTDQLSFPTDVKGWGHEDTLFGYLLEQKSYTIQHIDNPVMHRGLSNDEDYLKKQREAIEQVIVLAKKYPGFSYKLMDFHASLPTIVKSFIQLSSDSLLPWLSWLCKTTKSPKMLNIYKLFYYSSVVSHQLNSD